MRGVLARLALSAMLVAGLAVVTASQAGAAEVVGENFESGASGWTSSGFWHVQDHPETVSVLSPDINPDLVTLPDEGELPSAFGGTHAAWFGEASTGTYCGSDFNTIEQPAKGGCSSVTVPSGQLTSPVFSLTGADSAQVAFHAWWEIEAVDADSFDVMTVEYTVDGGDTWQQAGILNPPNNPAGAPDQSYTADGLGAIPQWHPYLVDLSGAAGQAAVQVRFNFNAGDNAYNGYRGWLVDDVSIQSAFSAADPHINSLDPNCVQPDQSVVVAANGTDFVSGSHVEIDGSNVGGSVLSSERVEFLADALAVGSHTIQVVTPGGHTSNTVTLKSKVSCASTGLTLTSTWSPPDGENAGSGRANAGEQALWQVDVANDGEGTVSDVGVHFTISAGAFDLNAMKPLNPGITCKKAPRTEPPTISIDCTIPSIGDGSDVVLKTVVDTTGVAAPSTITADVNASAGESTGSDTSSLFVDPADTDSANGYVPPGGTIDVGPGPKTLSTEDPVNGVVRLPKKITPPSGGLVGAANPKPVPGPGATLHLTLDDPSAHPGVCGGQDCLGKLLYLTNPDDSSCAPAAPPCDILIGYTDRKHPAFVTIDFFGGVFPLTSKLYKVVNEVGTEIPPCSKVKGSYVVTPCIAKHKVKKKTGQITDVVALLQGDPGIPRR